MAGWDVSQLIRNGGWLAKLGTAEFGWVGARDARPMVRGLCACSECILYAARMQRLRRAIGGCFERGFLGIVEVLFVIG